MKVRRWAAAWVLAVGLVTAVGGGCASTEDEGEASHFAECNTDEDCPEGESCRSSKTGQRRCVSDSTTSGDGPEWSGTSTVSEWTGSLESLENFEVPSTAQSLCTVCSSLVEDGAGNLLRATASNAQCDSGRFQHFCYRYVLDRAGDWNLAGTDPDCDGAYYDCYDFVAHPSGGGEGRTDSDCDGEYESCTTFEVTDQGTERWLEDDGCDGVVDQW